MIEATDDNGCPFTATLIINTESRITIGDFVFNDVNQNGIQDDGNTGINGVEVTLYQCNVSGNGFVETVVTTNNPVTGEPGYYSFEVCPNSGEYFVGFDAVDGFEFTTSNAGDDDAADSDADADGFTDCFTVGDTDIDTIDAGLFESCGLTVDAGEDTQICTQTDDIVELTANFEDSADCPGGCVFPVLTQERCSGLTGTFEIFLVQPGISLSDPRNQFEASEQNFETHDDGTAKYLSLIHI